MELIAGVAQQQVLSPQMQQSLQLLQAPVAELRQLVATELASNPVLEEEASDLRVSDPEEPDADSPSDRGVGEGISLQDEWRDYLQGELDADSSLGGVLNFPDDQGNMRDNWQRDEEDGEEWEEQPPTFCPEDELEPELEHAWSEPDAQPRGDEDD